MRISGVTARCLFVLSGLDVGSFPDAPVQSFGSFIDLHTPTA